MGGCRERKGKGAYLIQCRPAECSAATHGQAAGTEKNCESNEHGTNVSGLHAYKQLIKLRKPPVSVEGDERERGGERGAEEAEELRRREPADVRVECRRGEGSDDRVDRVETVPQRAQAAGGLW